MIEKNKNQVQIFSNKFLEFFTKTNPLLIFSMYIPLCALLILYSLKYIIPSAYSNVLYFSIGIFSWTLTEYILHRYIFHFEGNQAWQKRIHFLIHGIHHDFPRDKSRLIMPPIPSIILVTIFYLFFKIILNEIVYAFFSGFLFGYLVYAFIHYATHAIRPPKNCFRFLWKYHSLHHFKYPDKAYGVSSPLWDYIFGTLPPNFKAKMKNEK